jgi:hypothetical protein
MKNVSVDIGSVVVEGVPGRQDAASVRRGIDSALGRHLAGLPHNATDTEIRAAVAAALDRAFRVRGS